MQKNQNKSYFMECEECNKNHRIKRTEYLVLLKYLDFINCDIENCLGQMTVGYKVNDIKDWVESNGN